MQVYMQDPAMSTVVTSETAPSFPTSVHAGLPGPAVTRAPRRRWWPWILALGLAGIGAYLVFPYATQGQVKTPAPAGEGAAGAANARAVPVVVATARSGSMGVNLAGLGTVTPLNTVTVHTRVDGELVEGLFKEGQMVQQ